MSKLNQKVELVANVLIIVVALAIGGVLMQKYFFVALSPNEQVRLQPTVGSKMTAPTDVN